VNGVANFDPWARAAYYLVIDLEATTSEGGKAFPPHEMETIEIGAVLVRAATLEPIDEHQTFVRPVRHPVLLAFCMELTGIRQDMVDGAPLFHEAFAAMRARMIANRDGLVVWGSWGQYDADQFRKDCVRHGVHYDMPPHLNLKDALSAAQGWRKSYGMAKALTRCGLTLHGAHHRGIDDARNIVKMLPWIVGGQRTPWAK
jgi:inhibitor of KinA sporulation pathway (predicted exonuclease)